METGGTHNTRSVRESPAADDAGAESLGTLITGIVEDLQGIVRGEVQLAKTEIKENVSGLGKGAALIGAGVFLGLVGFIFVMLGVTYLLNKSLAMWIAALIVGLALLIIAAIAALIGKSRLSATSLKPEQTIESIKEDQAWANQQIKSVKE